jgi:hypothetical protein
MHSKKRTMRRNKKMMGGMGTADHAIAVFGGTSDQHAVGGGSNLIATTNVPSGGAVNLNVEGVSLGASSIQTGGKKRRSSKKRMGGNPVLVDLAVPAGFVLLRNAISRRRSTKRRNFSKRR